ncbi:MAG: hypothetical protein H6744_15620 [Deltaproteobacteria bacterium]|nr:hypothetical protein [Deltaproteobacteria bacterium]MCB9788110.1 hypothetical protein [Deltaproteobacteria bacterium]
MKALAIALLSTVLFLGCKSDPEKDSGGDAYRNEAQPVALDEWTTDDIARKTGDTTDWKAVDLADAGQLTVQLAADEADAEVAVAVFSRYGEPLGEVTRKKGEGRTKLTVPIARSGRHFLRIRQLSGPATAYTLRASLGVADDGPAPGRSDRPDF